MCSVRAERRLGLIPSASAASEEMWLWNAVRSGMTEPTTIPSRSAGLRPGTESKQALPASQIRSRYVAFRTPKRVMPAPTRATFRMSVLLPTAVAAGQSKPYPRARVTARVRRRSRSLPHVAAEATWAGHQRRAGCGAGRDRQRRKSDAGSARNQAAMWWSWQKLPSRMSSRITSGRT